MSGFRLERRAFERLKADCSREGKEEYELAFYKLLERYNTTIYENRFITGGVVEVFTCALLRSVGIDCTLYADQSRSGDILLPNDRKLSIKGTFTGGPSDVKLMNKQGEGVREWSTATLFVISEVGIVYGSPDMVSPKHVKDVKDGLVLKKAAIIRLMADASNVFEMKLMRKPPTEMTGFSHKASTAVVRQILFEMRSKALLKMFSTKLNNIQSVS